MSHMHEVVEVPKRSAYQNKACAQEYDADRFGGAFGGQLRHQEIELFCAMLNRQWQEVLDAGTGTGKLCLALLQRGWEVTSVDFSAEMLNLARQKVADEELPARFLIGDIESLCFADRAFDCTVSSRVLMHLPDWKAGIAELCRVTRHAIVIDFPPRLSFAGLDAFVKRKLRRRLQGRRQAYTTFSPGKVVRQFNRHDFHVVSMRRRYFLPILLHRWLNRPSLSTGIEGALARLGLVGLFGAPVTLKVVRGSSPQM